MPTKHLFALAFIPLVSACAAGSTNVRTTNAALLPGEQVAATVAAFDGKWMLDAKITASGQPPFNAKMDVDCQKMVGERTVHCDYRVHVPGQPDGGGAFLAGYDTFGAKVHFMIMNTDDEVHDHVCTWTDRTNLDCGVLEGGSGGKKVSEELRFAATPGKLSVHSISRFADGATLIVEASGAHAAIGEAQRSRSGS